MAQPAALADLIQRAEAGCAQSAQDVFELCRQPLLAVIRGVIHRRVRTLFDSDDFLLEAFSEIFSHHFQQETLQSPGKLRSYLKRIAENKVRDAHRKYLDSRRSNIRCEVYLEETINEDELPSPDFGPFDNLVLKELIEDRLADMIGQLPNLLQVIVRRLLDGWTAGAIANDLGVEAKRVYRAMEWLRKKIIDEA